MNLRIALPADAPAFVKIYDPYVRETAVTFDYETPTVQEFAGRIESMLKRYPCVVAETGTDILGYAYASAFKGKAAYDWSAETTIYVARESRRTGIGSALYQALEEWLRLQNICSLCACITYPNLASTAFHQRFGYRQTAHFHSAGFKLGAWHDIIWMEKELCPHGQPPKPFIPFSELS